MNGGMGTLVPLFYASLEYIRVSNQRRNHHQEEQQEQKESESTIKPPLFLNSALVDPNDPTTLYLTQPTTQQQPAKYPVV